MRKAIVRGRKEDIEKVRQFVEEINLQHFIYEDRIEIYVPDKDTEEIVGKIKNLLDMRYSKSVIEVYKPDFVVSVKSRTEKVEKRTPVEILMESLKRFSEVDAEMLALTAVASIVAFSGLVLNNAVIVVGAMLLSPLLGPIHGFTIYISAGKIKTGLKCLWNLVSNLFISIFVSALLSLLIFHPIEIGSEIALRIASNPYYSLMAVALGIASILSISKGVVESVAGVAVAASIIPPAVVSGMLFWSHPQLSLNALVLMLENVAGLLFGGLIAVQILEIKPTKYYERKVAAKYVFRSIILLLILLGILVVFSLYR